MRYLLYSLLVIIAIAAAAFTVFGIPGHLSRKPPLEVFPDMDRQAKLRPEHPFDFFTNGLTSQLPPAGTVVRSAPVETVDGAAYSYQDIPFNTGRYTGTTNFVATNPLVVTPVMLRRGRGQFDIYCAPCHGRLGDGNGITKKLGVMPAVASLHDKRIIDMTDGEIYNTISHGKGLMGAYGATVAVADLWAIVAYTRALELSRLGAVDDLPPDERADFKK